MDKQSDGRTDKWKDIRTDGQTDRLVTPMFCYVGVVTHSSSQVITNPCNRVLLEKLTGAQ